MLLDEVKDIVKNVLKSSKCIAIEDKLEKTSIGWNYVYYIVGITTETNFIVYTKIMFELNDDKKTLKYDKVVILYDLLCNYYVTDFNDTNELSKLLESLFKNGYNKGDIRELSEFSIDGTDKFNKLLKNTKENEFIYSLDFCIKNDMYVNCNNLVFNYELIDNFDNEYVIKIKKNNTKWNIICNDNEFTIDKLDQIYSKIIDKIYLTK